MIYDIEKAFRGVFGGDRALGRLDVASVGAGACALGAVVHNFGVAIGRWPVARWPLVTDWCSSCWCVFIYRGPYLTFCTDHCTSGKSKK